MIVQSHRSIEIRIHSCSHKLIYSLSESVVIFIIKFDQEICTLLEPVHDPIQSQFGCFWLSKRNEVNVLILKLEGFSKSARGHQFERS